MRRPTTFAAFSLLCLWSSVALADWTTTGVIVLCDKGVGRFQILSAVDSSDDESNYMPVAEAEQRWVVDLKDGPNAVSCQIGPRYTIEAEILIFAPSAQGQNTASGNVYLKAVRANGVEIMGKRAFNDVNVQGRTLVFYEVQAVGDKLSVSACEIPGWENRNDSTKVTCAGGGKMPANTSLERTRDR
jgi:hypothetical protein